MSFVACICEGHFERAIIDILLDHDCLIFNREEMLEEEVLDCRSAKEFQRSYLNKVMNQKITVYRILDSRNERFNITKPYEHKIKEVINVLTTPEIEMLIIHAEDCYDDYHKKRVENRLKPSAYVRQHLGKKQMKSYDHVYEYFSDVDKLLTAIRDYHSKTRIKEDTIYQLIIKGS